MAEYIHLTEKDLEHRHDRKITHVVIVLLMLAVIISVGGYIYYIMMRSDKEASETAKHTNNHVDQVSPATELSGKTGSDGNTAVNLPDGPTTEKAGKQADEINPYNLYSPQDRIKLLEFAINEIRGKTAEFANYTKNNGKVLAAEAFCKGFGEKFKLIYLFTFSMRNNATFEGDRAEKLITCSVKLTDIAFTDGKLTCKSEFSRSDKADGDIAATRQSIKDSGYKGIELETANVNEIILNEQKDSIKENASEVYKSPFALNGGKLGNVEVMVNRLRIRETPGLDGKILGHIAKGKHAFYALKTQDGYIWAKLEEGWVAMKDDEWTRFAN